MNKHSYPLIPCDNTEAVTGPNFQTLLSHFILLALTQRYTPYLRPDSLWVAAARGACAMGTWNGQLDKAIRQHRPLTGRGRRRREPGRGRERAALRKCHTYPRPQQPCGHCTPINPGETPASKCEDTGHLRFFGFELKHA